MTLPLKPASDKIDQFHLEIQQVEKLQSRSSAAKLWQHVTRPKDKNSPIDLSQKILEITKHANEIIRKLPVWMHDFKTVGDLLKDDSAWTSKDITKKDLEKFHHDFEKLFHVIIPKLKKNPFSDQHKIPKDVQEFLSSDIRQLRRLKNHDPSLIDDVHHSAQRKIAKGTLAIQMGHGIKTNKGVNGTLIVLDPNNKPVGIYRVSGNDISSLKRVIHLIDSLLWGQVSYLSKRNLAQPLAERAAFLISNLMGFNLVPPSAKTTIGSKKGVFQIFIFKEKERKSAVGVKTSQTPVRGKAIEKERKYSEAAVALKTLNRKDKKFSDEELTKFQLFAIFDYLIGNLDRHTANWLVALSQRGELSSIKAIDNANAFPKIHPGKFARASLNQYKWKKLKLAKYPFTESSQRFVKDHLAAGKIDAAINSLKRELGDFLDADMEQLFRKRAALIQLMVSQKSQSPAKLGQCGTDKAINAALGTYTTHA